MKLNIKNFYLPIIAIFIIVSAYILGNLLFANPSKLGLYPKDFGTLYGIITVPFIHSDLNHLLNNAVSLFVLLSITNYFYRKGIYIVIAFGIIISGIILWFIGRESYHVGASGLVYTLISYLFFKGITSSNRQKRAVALVVIFLYGGAIWYMLPNQISNISWEGHFGGFLAGLILGVIFSEKEEQKYEYDWEDPNFNRYRDAFMKHFDESGNFTRTPHTHTTLPQISIKYTYIKKENSH
ncbi:MAG: rhomboid family intramembrane serine protease [Bacteroidota bacterium]|nr:rhomboid family intramembrane serine protease [Bacteroidota bacterium]